MSNFDMYEHLKADNNCLCFLNDCINKEVKYAIDSNFCRVSIECAKASVVAKIEFAFFVSLITAEQADVITRSVRSM